MEEKIVKKVLGYVWPLFFFFTNFLLSRPTNLFGNSK